MTEPAYTHQPLGPGGRPLVIDRLSLAWLDWRGAPRLRIVDLLVEMAKITRQAPWRMDRRHLRVTHGRVDVLENRNVREEEVELALREETATVDTRIGDDLTMERGILRIHRDVPESYVASLPGRPLGQLLDLPFPFDAIIERATRHVAWFDIVLHDRWTPLPIAGLLEEPAE